MKKHNFKRGYFKQINLLPSEWQVDVWVCEDPNQIARCFNKRYGASTEYYLEEFYPNKVARIESTEESELKGRIQIVMQVECFDMSVIVHELIHVMWHYADAAGLEINYSSQEWQALLFERLYNECQPSNSFKRLKKDQR